MWSAQKKGLFLGQHKYAKDLLQRYGMIDCKPMSTPMDPNVRLQEDEREGLGGCDYVLTADREPYLSYPDSARYFLSSWSGQSIHEQSKQVSP